MMRNIAIIGAIILLALFPLRAAAQDNYAGDYPVYDGIWDTNLGTLALWQANDAVYGIYGNHALLGGHIDDDGVLHFSYEDDPDDMGTGWFKIIGDGTEFEGSYNSSVVMSIHDTWNGTYLGPNEFEIGDRDALDYQAGDAPPDYSGDGTGEETSEDSDTTDTEEEETGDEAGEFTGDVASAWAGTWDTNRGELEFSVEDENVTGTFGDEGEVEGTISGTSVSGTWANTDDEGNATSGEVLFTLSEDGMSFRGTYNTTDEPDLWLAWHGTKM